MADLTQSKKAPLYADGVIVTGTLGLTTTNAGIVSLEGQVVQDPLAADLGVADGSVVVFAVAHATGTATLDDSQGGRSGSLDVTVTAAPIVLSLGDEIAA